MTFLMALATIVVLLGACRVNKNDKVVKTTGKVQKTLNGMDSFERIKIDATCDVHFTQGDSTKVKVVASDAEIMAKTSVESEYGRLTIRTDGWSNWKKSRSVSIYITSPDLIEVDMDGVGSFQTRGTLDTDTLRLRMDGAGSIKIPSLICDRLKAEMDGTGSISLTDVTAQETFLDMDGVGSIKVKNFKNSGSVYCKMDGVGSIKLAGEVKTFQKKVEGVGSINTKYLKVMKE